MGLASRELAFIRGPLVAGNPGLQQRGRTEEGQAGAFLPRSEPDAAGGWNLLKVADRKAKEPGPEFYARPTPSGRSDF